MRRDPDVERVMEGGEREDVADVCPRLILGLTPLSFAPAGLVPSFGWSPTAYAVGCVLFAPPGLGFISALTTSDSRRGLIYRRCAAVSFLPFATHGLRRGLRSFRPFGAAALSVPNLKPQLAVRDARHRARALSSAQSKSIVRSGRQHNRYATHANGARKSRNRERLP